MDKMYQSIHNEQNPMALILPSVKNALIVQNVQNVPNAPQQISNVQNIQIVSVPKCKKCTKCTKVYLMYKTQGHKFY